MSTINLREFVNLETQNIVVQQALAEEQNFRQATITDLQALQVEVVDLFRTNYTDQDNFGQLLRKRVEQDKLFLHDFELLIGNYQTGVGADQVPYSVKTMKWKEIVDFVAGKRNSHYALLEGKFGVGFNVDSRDITVLGPNDQNIWGNSKGTFLKSSLLYLKAAFADYDHFLAGKPLEVTRKFHELPEFENQTYRQKHSFVYDAQLPKTLAEKPNSFTFEENGQTRIFMVHSGYAFGGHRDILYPEGQVVNPYLPHDCSSWIAGVTGSQAAYSTYDQLLHFRRYLKQDHFIEPGWGKSRAAVSLDTTCEPVVIRDPQRDIKEGQIYAHRRFDKQKDPDMSKTLGIGGHTALVTGFVSNGPDSQVVTIGYNRDMPNLEGFGLQAFPYKEFADRTVMLFDMNNV